MDIQIARVSNYYDKVHVAVIEIIDQPIHIGDHIRILGMQTDYYQTVTTLQVENTKVQQVEAGEICALGVEQPVKRGDMIYLQSKQTKL